jgi:hypothetical protein
MFKEGMEQGSKTHLLILGNALLQFRHFDKKWYTYIPRSAKRKKSCMFQVCL